MFQTEVVEKIKKTCW